MSARFAEMIFAGTKTIELRRVRPRVTTNDLVFAYASAPVKALEGAFLVNEVVAGPPACVWQEFGHETGLAHREFDAYFEGREVAFGLRIGRCWGLGSPIRLERLRQAQKCFHPPQGYQYITKDDLPAWISLASAQAGDTAPSRQFR